MRRPWHHRASALVALACFLSSSPGHGAEINAAVAANFARTLLEVVEQFELSSSHRVRLIPGSTGKLYAQIIHGAPIDVFFAADSRRPMLLETNGRGVAGTRFTYAVGRLVVWSRTRRLVQDNPNYLRTGQFNKLAIANPDIAPYGWAAREFLQGQNLWSRLQDRLVRGENISQTFRFVASGNADVGIVAHSLPLDENAPAGFFWAIPSDHYPAIEQQVILLHDSRQHAAAREFLDFMTQARAREIIRRFGYGLADE